LVHKVAPSALLRLSVPVSEPPVNFVEFEPNMWYWKDTVATAAPLHCSAPVKPSVKLAGRTVNFATPEEPTSMLKGPKPGADHSAPLHPSPDEVIVRMQAPVGSSVVES
tara:strand:+ start:1108 stop:1434 length:327 start_codon:yes stop_codon:yes gene_type:complete